MESLKQLRFRSRDSDPGTAAVFDRHRDVFCNKEWCCAESGMVSVLGAKTNHYAKLMLFKN
jgi:hypothetical protein